MVTWGQREGLPADAAVREVAISQRRYLDMLIRPADQVAVYLRLLIAYKSTTKRDREIYVKHPVDAILIWATVCNFYPNWAVCLVVKISFIC